ncbi:hypothetical protein AM1_E0055 (plasmid) [Acaryochloris marina MBIC11017]|uniref:Uncharacterized protein n=1 Tax=Acaryochloris marina (strain MBIC 11017) TaxID=329726 RepID=A8ZP89_ACAM1|nr:hypothetical protein AM1_E0055 [Acaryochloris marina MBIC11017]
MRGTSLQPSILCTNQVHSPSVGAINTHPPDDALGMHQEA